MKPTVSTAAASGGATGAAVVLVAWLLSLANIAVPAEVAAALMVLIAPLLHMLVVRFGLDPAAGSAPVVAAPTVVTASTTPTGAAA